MKHQLLSLLRNEQVSSRLVAVTGGCCLSVCLLEVCGLIGDGWSFAQDILTLLGLQALWTGWWLHARNYARYTEKERVREARR